MRRSLHHSRFRQGELYTEGTLQTATSETLKVIFTAGAPVAWRVGSFSPAVKGPQMQKEHNVRTLLGDAGDRLQQARRALFRDAPDHAAVLKSSLRAIRGAFAAFVTWHRLAFPEEGPLDALTRRAVPLASSLRTCAGRALQVEALAEATDGKPLARADREEVRAAYYTARNTFYAVFDELPEAVRPAPPVPRSAAFTR